MASEQSQSSEQPNTSRRTGTRKGKGANSKGATNAQELMQLKETSPGEKVFPDAFGVDKLRIRIKQRASDKIKGSFLPFTIGKHHCTVMFEDKEYGQFCYEIIGEVTLPAVFTEHKFTVATEGPQVSPSTKMCYIIDTSILLNRTSLIINFAVSACAHS